MWADKRPKADILWQFESPPLRSHEIAPALYRQSELSMLWSHVPVAPWQTPAWLERLRATLRPAAYVRMVENRFVTTDSTQWLPDAPSSPSTSPARRLVARAVEATDASRREGPAARPAAGAGGVAEGVYDASLSNIAAPSTSRRPRRRGALSS